VEALRCAIDLQRTVAEHNRNLPAGKRIEFRIGIHRGMWSSRMRFSSVMGLILLRTWKGWLSQAAFVPLHE
jgi:hypothetical protein